MRNFVYGGKNVNCFSLFSICFSNFVSSLFIFFYLKTVLCYCRRVQTVNSIKLIASKRVNCLISNYIYSSPDWVARTVTMLNSTFSMRYSMSSLTLPKIDFLDDFVNSAFVRQEVDWCEKCSSAFKHLNRINDFDSASFRGLYRQFSTPLQWPSLLSRTALFSLSAEFPFSLASAHTNSPKIKKH